MDPTESPPERRVCTACGKAKSLSRFPARGRGKSTVCRGCLADGKAPVPRPARRMTVEGGETPDVPSVAADLAPPVPTIVRGQVLEFAKGLRVTAHELRQRTAGMVAGMVVLTNPYAAFSDFGQWVDEVAAKNLDRAAAQLELLCG